MISPSTDNLIRIRGARVHNLRNLDVDIPRDAITVISGVSGSGKSSLAFDTLFAEGQRQYIDSLSTYARQYLDAIPRPDVDWIDGLAPTLSIDQKSGSHSARSTVATITEIYDYLRLLYARVGVPHCVACGSTISTQTPDRIVATLAALPDRTKLTLMSPMVRGRKGAHADVLEQIAGHGLVRARVDGEMYLLEDVPPLAVRKNHTIEAIVDRLIIKDGVDARLDESTRLALRLAGGMCSALIDRGDGEPETKLFSTSMTCLECGESFEELEPRTFSFNSPYGACPTCQGLGKVAVRADKSHMVTCSTCEGGRLKAESLAVTIHDVSIDALCRMPLPDAQSWMENVAQPLDALQQKVAAPIQSEVVRRIDFLRRVGVDYLTLDRSAETLSGGEMQRVRLATSIGSGLVGVCYVLDEPSIGLHPADHHRLLAAIKELQTAGNTIVIVEHDEDTIQAADHVIDIGPGAGRHGGRLVSQGTAAEVADDEASPTGAYLSGRSKIGLDRPRRTPRKSHQLTLTGATLNNLQNVTAKIPLGCLVGVSGVSGSGKSSLIVDTLYPALAAKLELVADQPGPHKRLTGAQHIDKLVPIDQTPIGRTTRSCPATYAGVMDPIRQVYASTREAKTLGFAANRFSFNSPAGRCDVCKGNGFERIEMNFLSDLLIECSRCGGKRFNRQTLQVRFKGASIADVLGMTIDAAQEFFKNVPKVHHLLTSLVDVGLGYVTLGQSSTTLSGGEAQRIKLATELARPATGKTFYVLDEPTTGLHFADVQRLLVVLDRLVEAGNTVLVIEHQSDLLAACDWLLDLGPGGGSQGGHLIAEGPPETIAACPESATGKFLRLR
ncbi:excinuclease ABC subunit UvrA [Rhodopirellula baltica]|uniref:UvrABC system protein A n=1 Tax=Rhodopirellula baltica SWK14 TaxID=993516 RepID=L7CAI5_RHOBT|nr:excinuclease ABC subunit UvrA [Rhodopirellula baltica]ELP31219.1 excinuclease ABC, A subunit [Rhodopirellula baltica SWK14]